MVKFKPFQKHYGVITDIPSVLRPYMHPSIKFYHKLKQERVDKIAYFRMCDPHPLVDELIRGVEEDLVRLEELKGEGYFADTDEECWIDLHQYYSDKVDDLKEQRRLFSDMPKTPEVITEIERLDDYISRMETKRRFSKTKHEKQKQHIQNRKVRGL